MKGDKVDVYLILVRCTHYNNYNTMSPQKTGSFCFEITEEFIGPELQAKEHFFSKYSKHCFSEFSVTDFQVERVYKLIQEEVPSNGR